jgi:hypothetical protein
VPVTSGSKPKCSSYTTSFHQESASELTLEKGIRPIYGAVVSGMLCWRVPLSSGGGLRWRPTQHPHPLNQDTRSAARACQGIIGDGSPLLAIEDELRAQPEKYEAIVLSTLPPGISRWLRLDVHNQAERKFGIPVIPVGPPRDKVKVWLC